MAQEPKKNSRVKQACDFCRSRKAKCDGKLPHCTACSANPENCIYSTSSKRRGLPSGYTHDLERKVLAFQVLISYVVKQKDVGGKLQELLVESLSQPIDAQNILSNIQSLQELWKSSDTATLFDNFIIRNSESIQTAKKAASNGTKPAKVTSEPGTGIDNNNNNSNPAFQQTLMVPTAINSNLPNQNVAKPNEKQPQSLVRVNHEDDSIRISIRKSPNDTSITPNLIYNTFSNTPLFNIDNGSLTQDYNILGDPAYFLKDEMIYNEMNKRNSWEPITLHYHEFSSLISGFSWKSIQEYNNKLNFKSKKPFRVGSIFNLSSSSISASPGSSIELPSEIFEFPLDMEQILDCYFTIYHAWFPILNRLGIMNHIRRLAKNATSYHQQVYNLSDCNIIALIWAILALGKFSSNAEDGKVLGNIYAKNCIKALENSPTTSIEIIQSMMVLGLYYYQTGDWDRSWVVTSSATRMAIDVRLMAKSVPDDEFLTKPKSKAADGASISPSSSSDGSVNIAPGSLGDRNPSDRLTNAQKKAEIDDKAAENTTRERTWSCVYFLNTLLSSRLGRSPLIRAGDWPTPTINEDAWEEWESWTSYFSPKTLKIDSGRCLSTFNRLIQVVSIWNLALTCQIDLSEDTLSNDLDDKIYKTPNAIGKDGKRGKRTHLGYNTYTLAYFKKTLQVWRDSLPDYCKLEYFSDMSRVPPFVAYIHLSYAMVWCVLAIRLSQLRKSIKSSFKDRIISYRDSGYSTAILLIQKIITKETLQNLKVYPFMDYFLLITLSFPKMMQFVGEAAETKAYRREMKSLLFYASNLTNPFKTTYEVYNLVHELDTIIDSDGQRHKRPADSKEPPRYTKLQKLMEDKTIDEGKMGVKRENSITAIAGLSSAAHVPTRTSSPYNLIAKGPFYYQPSGRSRNIDSFMLDLDLGKAIKRQQDFVTHLGFVNKKNEENEEPKIQPSANPYMNHQTGNIYSIHGNNGRTLSNAGLEPYPVPLNQSQLRHIPLAPIHTVPSAVPLEVVRSTVKPEPLPNISMLGTSLTSPNPLISPMQQIGQHQNQNQDNRTPILGPSPVPSLQGLTPFRYQESYADADFQLNNVFIPSSGLSDFLSSTLSKPPYN